MEKIELPKDCRRILKALYENNYDTNQVPEIDWPAFKILKQRGFVKYVSIENGGIIAPTITERGEAYLAENPELKNPSIFDDKKYWINLAISIFALIISLIALFK